MDLSSKELDDSIEKDSYLERFLERNMLKIKAKWNRYLSLKTLKRIYEETNIRELELTPSSFKAFCRKYKWSSDGGHLKTKGDGQVIVENPIPIHIITDRFSLIRNIKKSSGRKRLHPEIIQNIQFLDHYNMKQKDIAKLLKTSQSSVSKYIKREQNEKKM